MLLRVVDGRASLPNRLELGLIPGSDVSSVMGLAQREVSCCPFFTFTFEIAADRLVLTVDVPNDAIEVLDHLVDDARKGNEPNCGIRQLAVGNMSLS